MDCVVGKKHPNLRLDTIFKHSFIKVSGVKAQVDTLNLQSQQKKVPSTNISVHWRTLVFQEAPQL